MLIKQMLDLQQQLNDETNGLMWLHGKTKEGRVINWHMCIYMEAVEALNSFNWKHWKDISAKDDLQNVKVELVDIWHFIMSEIIRTNKQQYLYNYQLKAVQYNKNKLIKSLEKLISLASSYADITIITAKFFNALQNSGITLQELHKNYMVKNVLNKFRQDNGYKNNTYKKNWNGVEDNIVAFDILCDNQNITAQELYKKLTIIYARIK